jgi:hypothetical protein
LPSRLFCFNAAQRASEGPIVAVSANWSEWKEMGPSLKTGQIRGRNILPNRN